MTADEGRNAESGLESMMRGDRLAAGKITDEDEGFPTRTQVIAETGLARATRAGS